MLFRVRIEPVSENAEAVIEQIMVFLGPDSRDRAERLVEAGGIVVSGFNRQAADHAASLLEEAGADATVEQEGSGEPTLTVAVRDRETERPVTNARVEILGDGDAIVSGTTGSSGEAAFDQFAQRVEGIFGERRPQIMVRVQRRGQAVDVTHKPFKWEEFDASGGDFTLRVHAAAPGSEPTDDEPPAEGRFVVHGTVTYADGEPAAGVLVRAFDRDLRREELLGEGETNEQGQYFIAYDPAGFSGSEEGTADLEFRLLTETGRELDAEIRSKESARIGDSVIRFNAGREERIDLTVREEDMSSSLYEKIVVEVAPLLGDVQLQELNANDVLFLHHDTGRPLHEIAFVADDARLQNRTAMPEAVFFGLGLGEVGVEESSQDGVPSIDLPLVLERSVDELMEVVGSAIEKGRIPSDLKAETEAIRRRFEKLKAGFRVESARRRKERAERLGRIAGLDEDTSRKIAERSGEAMPTDEILSDLAEEGVLDSSQVPDVKLAFDLDELTGHNAELVETIKSGALPQVDGPVQSARELAALDADDWATALEENDVSPPGDQERGRYARKLAWDVERRFPTEVFAARTVQRDLSDVAGHIERAAPLLGSHETLFTDLVRGADPEIDASDGEDDFRALAGMARTFKHVGVPGVLDDADLAPSEKAREIERRIDLVRTFFSNNEGIDLRHVDLVGLSGADENGSALNFEGIEETDRPKVRRQARAFQRVMSLAPHANSARTLLEAGYSSARDVAKIPLSDFYSSIELSPGEAVAIHTQATLDADYTNFVAGNLIPLLPGIHTHTEVDNVDDRLVNKLRELDSYEEMFGSQAGCDCAHCRSVFGPLAYYVDLMVFVEQNFLKHSFENRPEHAIHLKTRRPDLWDQLELSCANATTLIPYLDVVNDVLTRYVGRVEELEPESDETIEDAVFALFSHGDRSFEQPVHLPFEELRLTLDRLGVDVVNAFRRSGAGKSAMTRARLGFSTEEISAITTSIAGDTAALRRRYGLGDDAEFESLTTHQLMSAAGLTRDELGRLAELDYIDAGSGGLRIEMVRLEDELQPRREEIRGLNADRLDRIFRFVRLWRAVPWTLEALDYVIGTLEEQGASSGISNGTLDGIGSLLGLQEEFDLSIEEVCGLVDRIPTSSLKPGEPSLYDGLFNQDVFVDQGGRFEPNEPRLLRHPYFDAPPTTEAGSDPALPRLLSAFEVSEEDFVALMGRLRGPLNPVSVVSGDGDEARAHVELTLDNLTLLYRHAIVLRRLDIDVEELFRALDLTQTQIPAFLAGEAELRDLLAFIRWTREAGFAPSKVAFVTGGDVDADRTLDGAAAKLLAEEATKKVRFTADAFSEISGLEGGDVETLLTTLSDDGRIVEESEGVYRLTASHDSTDLPTLPNETLKRRKDAILNVLNRYLPEVHAAQMLTEKLEITTDRLRSLHAIVAGSFADHDHAIDRAQGLKLTSASTSESDLLQYLEPLEEAVVAAGTLDLTDADVHLAAREPDVFGLNPGTDHPIGQDTLRRLAAYAKLRERFEDKPAELEAFVTDEGLGQDFPSLGASVRDRLAGKLAALGGVPADLARSILANVPASSEAVHVAVDLVRALDLARDLGTSGSGLAQLTSTRYEDLEKARDAAYSTLYARYNDEESRKAALKPIADKVRGRKRDALVSHLVARPELNFDDASDLYHYFLLDPEMEGCAMTSRVVAGTNSLQLYVHRCMMHLEQTERDPASPPGEDDVHVYPQKTELERVKTEWEWRKNYRVWEANRKIFLYPENYLEPDLRDNKTPPFQELEERLMQEDLDEAAAEKLYRGYLDRYSEVANLRIAGAYFAPLQGDDGSSDGEISSEGTVYVVGRTADQPNHFYLRRRDREDWSAWERIDLDIQASEVSPIKYLDRLYLFWIESKTKPYYRKDGAGNDEFVAYHHVITLKYSVQSAEGEWTAPQEVALPESIATIEDPISTGGRGYISDGKHYYVMSSVIIPKLQATHTPEHCKIEKVETSDGLKRYKLPSPRDDYALKHRLYNRIFPFVYDGTLFFLYGLNAHRRYGQYYRLDVLSRKAVGVPSIDRPPAVTFDFSDTTEVGSLRMVREQKWIEDPTDAATPDAVEIFLTRNATYDKYRYYYESEKERTQVYERPPVGSAKDWQGKVPFDATIQSVNNAPHLWILERSDGSALLRRTGRIKLSSQRLRTRVPEDLKTTLFRENIWQMLATETQDSLEENHLFENERLAWSPVATGGVHPIRPKHSYKTYNWEVFCHAPLLIANTLNAKGRYEEAERWYNVVFDPTAEDNRRLKDRVTHPHDRNWRFLGLRKIDLPHLKDLLNASHESYEAYRQDPFNPHAVARERPVAYQRSVVMRYVDNLLDWGDELFTRDTRESINEAMLLYVTAADILGKRPAELGACKTPGLAPTYEALESEDGFIVTVENMVRAYGGGRPMSLALSLEREEAASGGDGAATRPSWSVVGSDMPAFSDGAGFVLRGAVPINQLLRSGSLTAVRDILATNGEQPSVPDISGVVGSVVPYSPDLPVFCVPQNTDMLKHWDRVQDRLFKIRNCMNIEGVRRSLALFEPPIEPGLLARARAAGLALDDVLGAAAGELPPYRFSYLIGKAKEYVSTLRGLGGALLAALEKKDAEELAQLRSTHQQNIQRMTKRIRKQQIETARESKRSLEDRRARIAERHAHLKDKIDKGWNNWETTSVTLSSTALATHTAASIIGALAPAGKAVPDVEVGYASLGGFATIKYGSEQTGGALQAAAQILRDVTTGLNMGAGIASTLGSFERRADEWKHQRDLARMELEQVEKDILAAEIRVAIAERELEIHETQMEQTEEIYDFYKSRFSNLGLYTWLASEVKGLYRQAYRMALEIARMAEAAYRYEREESTTFIEPGIWDSEHAGLLSGEKLMMQLQEMDKAYLESNQRDFEVNQTFSLAQIDPEALHNLRQNGSCTFKLAEPFFDLTYPGQYLRRIRSVRLTIPCVTGPYVNVNAKLTLVQGYVRRKPSLQAPLIDEPRSRNTSIATSQAQNDGGVFELNFRDERYVPFEGAGAVSEWKLELPTAFRAFDYDTISDVLVHVSYTAKEDGDFRSDVEGNLRSALNNQLRTTGISRGLSLGQEFANEFRHLFRSHDGDEQTVSIRLDHRLFPYFLHGERLKLTEAIVGLRLRERWNQHFTDGSSGAGPVTATVKISVDGREHDVQQTLKKQNGVSAFDEKIPHAVYDLSGANAEIGFDGVGATFQISKQNLLDLYKNLHSAAGVSLNGSEPSPEDLRDVIEDVYLVLNAKLEGSLVPDGS